MLKVNALEQNTLSESECRQIAGPWSVFFLGCCRVKAGNAVKGPGLRGHLLSSQMGALHLDESLLVSGKRWILERPADILEKKCPPHILINPTETFLKVQDNEKQFLSLADDWNLSLPTEFYRLRPLNQEQLQEFEANATQTGNRPDRPHCPADGSTKGQLAVCEITLMKFCPTTHGV